MTLAGSREGLGPVQGRQAICAPERMGREERLRVLAETAGALKSYVGWDQELPDVRSGSRRDVWGDDRSPQAKS